MGQETPREKFLRNHQEERHTQLAMALAAERDGHLDRASRIRQIVAMWDKIAKSEGESAKPGEQP